MPPLSIHVCDYYEADSLMSRPKIRSKFTHAVSIGMAEFGPHNGEAPAWISEMPVLTCLRLNFDDVENVDAARRAGYYPPTMDHVVRLVRFCCEQILSAPANVLLHCSAGVSRSCAAALVLLFLHCNDVDEAAKRLVDARPQAYPNSLFVALADDFMQCGGDLVRASEAVRRARLNGNQTT